MYDLQPPAWNANRAAELLNTAMNGEFRDDAGRQWYATAGLGYAQLVTAQILAAEFGTGASDDEKALRDGIQAIAIPPRRPVPPVVTYKLWESPLGEVLMSRQGDGITGTETYLWREPDTDVDTVTARDPDEVFAADAYNWGEGNIEPHTTRLDPTLPDDSEVLGSLRLLAEYTPDHGGPTMHAEPRSAAGLNMLRAHDEPRERYVDRLIDGSTVPVALSWTRTAGEDQQAQLRRSRAECPGVDLVRIDGFGVGAVWEAVNTGRGGIRGQWIITRPDPERDDDGPPYLSDGRERGRRPSGVDAITYELRYDVWGPVVIRSWDAGAGPDGDVWADLPIEGTTFARDMRLWDAGVPTPAHVRRLGSLATDNPDTIPPVARWRTGDPDVSPADPSRPIPPALHAYLERTTWGEAPAGWDRIEPGPEQTALGDVVDAVIHEAHCDAGDCAGDCADRPE